MLWVAAIYIVVLLRATCLTVEFKCYEVKTEVECWRLKPGVLGLTPGFFTFLYFCLITSKYIYYGLSCLHAETVEYTSKSRPQTPPSYEEKRSGEPR